MSEIPIEILGMKGFYNEYPARNATIDNYKCTRFCHFRSENLVIIIGYENTIIGFTGKPSEKVAKRVFALMDKSFDEVAKLL